MSSFDPLGSWHHFDIPTVGHSDIFSFWTDSGINICVQLQEALGQLSTWPSDVLSLREGQEKILWAAKSVCVVSCDIEHMDDLCGHILYTYILLPFTSNLTVIQYSNSYARICARMCFVLFRKRFLFGYNMEML